MWALALSLWGCAPTTTPSTAIDPHSCADIEGATKRSIDAYVYGDAAIVPCRTVRGVRSALISGGNGAHGQVAIGSSTVFHLGTDPPPDDGTWPREEYPDEGTYEYRAVVYLRDLDASQTGLHMLERLGGEDVEVPTAVDWEGTGHGAWVTVTDQWADLDGDGINDLLLHQVPDMRTSWLPETEGGLSTVPSAEVLPFTVVTLGDLDGDGTTDLGRFDTFPDGAVNDDGAALRLSVQLLPVSGSLADAPWEIQLGTDLFDADHWGYVDGWPGDGLVQGGFDHNGDGIADVVVGAEMPDEAAGERGIVHVFDGPIVASRSGGDADAQLSRFGADCTREAESWNCDSVGSAVKSSGDLDGDGYPDLLVASRDSWANGIYRSGSLFVVPGPLEADMDLDEVAVARLDGGSEGAHFPDFMQGRGDLDADGRSDVIVAQNNGRQEGGMVIHHGPVEGVQDWQDGTWLCGFTAGSYVSFDTDVDGDGVHDMVYNEVHTSTLHIWYSTISMEYPRPDSDCFL